MLCIFFPVLFFFFPCFSFFRFFVFFSFSNPNFLFVHCRQVIGRPAPVTTDGEAYFEFACSLNGVAPQDGCSYEYQMVGVGSMAEVDWNKRGWLPTVSYCTLFDIIVGSFCRTESQQKK